MFATSPTQLRHHRPRAAVDQACDATEPLHHIHISLEQRLSRGRDRVDAYPGDLGKLTLERAETLRAFLRCARERELVEHVVGDEVREPVRKVGLGPEVP